MVAWPGVTRRTVKVADGGRSFSVATNAPASAVRPKPSITALTGASKAICRTALTVIAGDVWVAVARHLGRFVGDEAGFRRWLFTIARCRLIEAHRRQARQRTAPTAPETFDDHAEPHPKADRDDPAAVVIDQMTAQQAVDTIVAGLSPDQAEVVLLRIVAGLGVSEVAAIMGRSPTSVRVLCHRALRHLRDRFPEGHLIR